MLLKKLCIICLNFNLFLTSLINFERSKVSELDETRSETIKTIMCPNLTHLISVFYENVKFVWEVWEYLFDTSSYNNILANQNKILNSDAGGYFS